MFQDYNNALRQHSQGRTEEAKDTYKKLLTSNLLTSQVLVPPKGQIEPHSHRASQESLSKELVHLKYSALKNLATLEEARGDTKAEALQHYLAATALDYSDATVWYHIGCLALGSSSMGTARRVRLTTLC